MSTVRRPPHRHAWLRALVLLLALLVPGAPAQTHAAHVVAGEIAEHDVLDTALRPPARAAQRAAVPLRPAPRPEPVPGVPADRPRPAPPRPPYALPVLRSVVLRC
ncbi:MULTISPECIES: hypothetical protein [unclassified Streptomyces]|uniref:hypothetical protein n=1 Tax=unclassified Streptomyces TaxID=2593676 RepID=UPI000FAD871E|nr:MULTISPECIES: hypothetical protein [unclassified Streptomyces]MDH6451273.1 hypothetical protein [Streptomyces sp. SAI-119]MDH6498171.1 hypothetical protein [Streptomyces sp. SAI-149]